MLKPSAFSLLAVAFLTAWASGTEPGQSSPTQNRPWNVLLIAADDLRNDLGCYGHDVVRSPHLDRLAASGVIFDRAYCQQALCNPSRASMMTGLRPDTLKIWNLPLHFRQVRPELKTLPQSFKENGYFTQNIGKIYHNWRQPIQGDPASWSVPAVLHYATHGSDTPQVNGTLPPNQTRAARTEARDVPDEAYFDGRIAELAVAAIQERARSKQPFFLAVGFWKPHLPFNPPKKYWDQYQRSTIKLPANPLAPRNVPKIALHDSRELMRDRDPRLAEDEVRELRHGYLAGISYLDAQVGKLLQALKQNQLEQNTIVVFYSDHGFHLGEHGLWCKTSNFELDTRVPLMIRVPGLARGRASGLVELLDVYPTLTELCGIARPEQLEGESLVTLLQDPDSPGKPAAYSQHPRPAYYQDKPEVMGVSVRSDDYRLTQWREFDTGKIVAQELYDHRHDQAEMVNLIGSPREPGPETLGRLRELLNRVFPAQPYEAFRPSR